MVLFPPSKKLNYGLSQGSKLGPLLFLIYVNDIHNIAYHFTNDVIKQFADDTCIIVKARNTTELKFETNALFYRIEQWSSANKLTIKLDQTKAIIISQKLIETVKNITLYINDFSITYK